MSAKDYDIIPFSIGYLIHQLETVVGNVDPSFLHDTHGTRVKAVHFGTDGFGVYAHSFEVVATVFSIEANP
ncbi:MAG: hypothetical protein JJV98_13810 [Desulfosarcina sp.]|nr:hypothetical protein [Desulfobacterales bacterium]